MEAFEFPLFAIEGATFYFDGLTGKREARNKMAVSIKIQREDQPFRYGRGKP